MVIWRDHLTQAEIDELAAIDRAKKDGQRQARRIYDRCRKRMAISVRTAMAVKGLLDEKGNT